MRLFLIAAVPVAFLLYGHGLEAPLYYDDARVLESAVRIPGLKERSLGYLSFHLNGEIALFLRSLFHWDLTLYFRIGNLLVHILTATVVVGLVRELTRFHAGALAAGFLFLMHSAVSEPVMYISQRFESLATMFMVVSAAAYARFRNVGNWTWFATAVIAGIAAVLSKETAAILPLWIVLMELTFFQDRGWNRRYVSGIVAAVAILAVPVWPAFRSFLPGSEFVAWDQHVVAQGGVLFKYLQLSVLPLDQYLLYGVGIVPGFSWRLFGEWAVVLAVLTTGIVLIRRRPTIGFGILTFFVLLLPGILVPRPDLIFEYRLYPGFVGLAIAGGGLFQLNPRKLGIVLLAAVLIGYGARTFQRSGEWVDEIAFYEAHRTRFPGDPRILAILAVRYYSRGDVRLATQALEEARRNEHRFNNYYSKNGRLNVALNLISVSVSAGDYERARAELRRALALGPNEPSVLQIAGSLYMVVGEHERAVAAYEKLTERQPSSMAGWVGLSDAYRRLGDVGRADSALGQVEQIVAERPVPDERPRFPAAYRMPVIFALLVSALMGAVFILRWAWLAVRKPRVGAADGAGP